MLRFLWVAAFHPDETVSSVPQLDSYVPGERSGTSPMVGASQSDPSNATPSTIEPSIESDQAHEPGEGVVDDDGIWIELDIEPLFSSSDRPRIVDLTEAEDPEVTP